MAALRLTSPLVPTDVLRDAVARAAAEATSVGGASALPVCNFHVLDGPPAGAAGRAAGPADGIWVLVACRAAGETAHRVHLRERCRTAAQRFTLALWADRVPAVWTEAEGEGALAGLAPAGMAPVGLVWCPADVDG